MRAVIRSIRRQARGVDLLLFDRHPLEWRGIKHPFSHLSQKETQDPTYQVDLTDGFEGVLGHSNAKRRRKKFRTSEKRLDAFGGYDHVRATTREEADDLLRHFYCQKAKRFKLRNIHDIFAPAEMRAFLGQLTAESIDSDDKTLEFHAIRLRDPSRTPCAIAALSIKGRHVLCQFSSIATGETEAASPGELLFHLMIQKACEENAELFDFGMGDERFKRSWCNIKTHQYYLEVVRTPMGYLASTGLLAKTFAKRAIKSNPRLNAGARRLRELAGEISRR
jgi:CelD/BcsL family acetyltransferase involved in cellulose biosynthesis